MTLHTLKIFALKRVKRKCYDIVFPQKYIFGGILGDFLAKYFFNVQEVFYETKEFQRWKMHQEETKEMRGSYSYLRQNPDKVCRHSLLFLLNVQSHSIQVKSSAYLYSMQKFVPNLCTGLMVDTICHKHSNKNHLFHSFN